MSMETLNIIIGCLFLFSLLLVIAGIVICVFLPERPGGKFNRGKRELSSLAFGLPPVFIGIVIFLLVLEPAYDREARDKYLGMARYYLWADRRFIISGGKHKTDKILVDDDLRVRLNGNQILLNDKDRIRSDYSWAKYKGDPIIFFSTDVQQLKIVARDVTCCTYSLSPLYLHRPDGTVMKLTDGVKEEKYEKPSVAVRLFFNETYELAR